VLAVHSCSYYLAGASCELFAVMFGRGAFGAAGGEKGEKQGETDASITAQQAASNAPAYQTSWFYDCFLFS
jgi:hypothetical protein